MGKGQGDHITFGTTFVLLNSDGAKKSIAGSQHYHWAVLGKCVEMKRLKWKHRKSWKHSSSFSCLDCELVWVKLCRHTPEVWHLTLQTIPVKQIAQESESNEFFCFPSAYKSYVFHYTVICEVCNHIRYKNVYTSIKNTSLLKNANHHLTFQWVIHFFAGQRSCLHIDGCGLIRVVIPQG